MAKIVDELVIEDRFGNPVPLSLSIPAGAIGTVVFSHGFTSSRNSRLYVELEREFNARGIGSVRYDYYGHGALYGYANTYGVRRDITLSKAAASLGAVLRTVKERAAGRIVLLGSSFGGLVSLVAVLDGADVAGLMLKSPVSDPLSFWKQRLGQGGIEEWEKKGFAAYTEGGSAYELDVEFLRDIQTYDIYGSAARIRCPVLIVHGDNDSVVPISQSERLSSLLNCRLHVVRGAGHGYKLNPEEDELKEQVHNFVGSLLCPRVPPTS